MLGGESRVWNAIRPLVAAPAGAAMIMAIAAARSVMPV
jgi:hypothetical protein